VLTVPHITAGAAVRCRIIAAIIAIITIIALAPAAAEAQAQRIHCSRQLLPAHSRRMRRERRQQRAQQQALQPRRLVRQQLAAPAVRGDDGERLGQQRDVRRQPVVLRQAAVGRVGLMLLLLLLLLWLPAAATGDASLADTLAASWPQQRRHLPCQLRHLTVQQ
jgi:hypothetical protein